MWGERDESDPHLFSLPSYLAQGLKGGPRHQFTTDWGWEISSPGGEAGSGFQVGPGGLVSPPQEEESEGLRKSCIWCLPSHLLLGASPVTERWHRPYSYPHLTAQLADVELWPPS